MFIRLIFIDKVFIKYFFISNKIDVNVIECDM